MRPLFRLSGLLMAMLGCLCAADVKTHVPGHLLVGHLPGVDPNLEARVLALHGAAVRRHVSTLRASVIEVPEAAAEAIRASLERTGLFAYVEPDYYARTGAVPNDPSYGAQWHLPKIAGPQAWSMTTGSGSITIAVVDSGVYGNHPDLAAKILPGWNFVSGNSDTSDVAGHGTAVAGSVAAASNNGVGVAGVNWASRIMPLVVVEDGDYASYSNIAAGILYAADHGARIINVSIGGTSPSATLQNAVDYAWLKGSLIFAAAMNDHVATPYYPAACNHVMAVSATDSADHLASFSNYGTWISLSAPGTNILTTNNGGGYGYWSGTSFASPIAAGVAALCLAVNPALTPAELVRILELNADHVGTGDFDPAFGWGRVNAWRAVIAALKTLPPQPDPVSPRHPGYAPARH